MSSFDYAIEVVRKHEGGYTGDEGLPGDPGGPTNFGWSLRQMQADGWDVDGDGDVDLDDVRALTDEVARQRYRLKFWLPSYEKLEDLHVSTKTFDIAIHSGHRRAALVLQRACNALGARIVEDGDLGPMTINAANRIATRQALALLVGMAVHQASMYGAFIAKNQELERFRRNWTSRAMWPFRADGDGR